MKFITLLLSVLATSGAALDSEASIQATNEIMKVESVSPKTATYNCPNKSFIGQVNANLGGILDRVNFRCNNNPGFSNFGDIGAPLSNVRSPKSNTLRLPNLKKGWDRVNVGYSFYEPKGQEVVVSIQLCQQNKCFETGFFYGLTICSADASKEYACPKISSYEAAPGEYFTGVMTTFVPQKDTGYVISLAPIFK